MMRFIVDAQLPPALARALTDAGFVTAHVADIGLLRASDKAIWDRAAKERAAIITKDGDFAYLHRREADVGVVWLRIGNTATEPLLQWLLPLMPEVVAAMEAGERLVEIQR